MIEDLKELLDDYDQFYRGLDDNYAGGFATVRKWIRRQTRVVSVLFGVALGIGASLLGNYLYDGWRDPPQQEAVVANDAPAPPDDAPTPSP